MHVEGRHRNRILLGLAFVAGWALFWPGARDSGPDTPGPAEDWTLVLLADTQGYTTSGAGSRVLEAMFGWIRDNRERERIALVVHVGDLVQNNHPAQWRRIREAFALLDGIVPYVVAVGNHDLGPDGTAYDRSTLLNDYFRLADNPLNAVAFGGSFAPGALENAWYRIVVGGEEFLVFSLEFGPRRAVADWAGSVAGRFPSLPAILVTHEFIDMKSALAASDGLPRRTTRHSPGSGPAYRLGGTGDALCGADLWERLVGPHAGFEFVFSGHYFHRERDASGRSLVTAEIAHAFRSDVRPEGCCAGNGMPNQRTRGGKQNGPAGPSGGLCAACRPSPMGRTVHQMLFNPQWLPGGGQGWLRLLRFSADRSHVRVETFSPWLEREVGPEAAFRTNAAHRFIIPRGGAPP